MEINNLKKDNEIKIENNLLENKQTKFLETTIGKTINAAIDIGIRALLPDLVEDEVINLKDNLFNYGLKEGVKKTINDAISLGKNTIGIVTGNFENINQIHNVIQTKEVIESISDLLDYTINKTNQAGLINSNIAKTIKAGKNVILDNVQSNIEKTFTKQYESIEKVNNYISNWKNNYENKNFDGMEKEYNKLSKELKNLVPLEKTINEARSIENLHLLIKNNGQNFEITEEQIKLAKKLI